MYENSTFVLYKCCQCCFYREVSNLGGVEALIHCLGDFREEVVANAACGLTNMAQEESLRSDALAKGVVHALIEPLKSQ